MKRKIDLTVPPFSTLYLRNKIEYPQHFSTDGRKPKGFSWLQNKDALILVLQGPYEEPKAHMVLPKGED